MSRCKACDVVLEVYENARAHDPFCFNCRAFSEDEYSYVFDHQYHHEEITSPRGLIINETVDE